MAVNERRIQELPQAMLDTARYPKAPLGGEMTYLSFVLRRVVVVAIVAGLLCVLALLFALPFLFAMVAA